MANPILDNRVHKLYEEALKKSPRDLKYQKAFFRLGKTDWSKDVIFFPVDIADGRTCFGKLQLFIVPPPYRCSIASGKWVGRDKLVLEHDVKFNTLDAAILKDLGLCPQPPDYATGIHDRRALRKVYEGLYTKEPIAALYQRAFYRISEENYSGNRLNLAVQIRSGRVSFGRPQFLIVPYGAIVEQSAIGCRWVDRKALVMEHDLEFQHIEKLQRADDEVDG